MSGTPRNEWYSSSPDSVEVLEARMVHHIIDRNRLHLFRDQAGEPLAQGHAQRADRTGMQAQGRREHHVRAIRLEQVGRAHIRPEPFGNQCHNIHQRIGRLAALSSEIRKLFQRQNEGGFGCFICWGHRYGLPFE